MHARFGAFGRIGKRDRQRRMQVLAAGRDAEFLRLELRTKTARSAGSAAEHPAQQIFEAATAAAASGTGPGA